MSEYTPQNSGHVSDLRNSKNSVAIFILFAAFVISFLWIFQVKPPFMSPDEGAHLARADALRNGDIVLFSPDGKLNSGGFVDKSMNEFRSKYDPLISSHDASLPGQLKNDVKNQYWSGEKVFYSMANTTFYFPAVYIPQAIGLQLGHLFNMNLYNTYKLVSILTLLVIFTLLVSAWKVFPIPTPAMAVLLLPMTIFQFCSPTIDGITFALVTLAMSLTVRSLQDKENDKRNALKFTVALAIVIFMLSSSRANLLPLILIPLWIYFKTRQKASLVSFSITALLVLSWTYFSIKTVHDNGIHHPGIEQIDVLKHYITHPFEVLTIILNTLSDFSLISFYAQSFIGNLGWLDTHLSMFSYFGFGLLIYTLFALNITKENISARKSEFTLLVLLFLSVVMLTFCALLVQWSAFPAEKVDGVQGRYFIAPCIILSYALMDNYKLKRISLFALVIMGVTSVYSVHAALAMRYFQL